MKKKYFDKDIIIVKRGGSGVLGMITYDIEIEGEAVQNYQKSITYFHSPLI